MDMNPAGSEPDEAEGPEARGIPTYKLSCDQCRKRKVRCDRLCPCTSCSSRQDHCSYPTGFKPRAKRQRITASIVDDRLDDIVKKLDRISVAVDNIGTPLSHLPPAIPSGHATHRTSPSYASSPLAGAWGSDNASPSDLEGDVSLAEQAAFATDFAQNALDGGHLLHAWPDITSKLDALRNALLDRQDQGHKHSSLDRQLISPVLRQSSLELPPMDVAMSAIQMLKGVARLKLFCFVEFESTAQFLEYFMNAYSGQPSLADFVIVFCGLHALLRDCSNIVVDQARKDEFASHAGLCRRNLEFILANLPFHLPCTFDYVLALFMASTYYLEICRTSTAWTLLSTAVQMCLTLGFHRDVPARPETREQRSRRIRLFWFIHMVDKMISLRLNRASVLRDEDITTPVENSEDALREASLPIIPKWIKISMLQGKVYDDIYSPGALLQPEAVREARARELAAELQAAYDAPNYVEHSFYERELKNIGQAFQNLFIRSDRINHLAVLTLVYRSIRSSSSSSAFCDECLTTAKECLEEHKTCLGLLRDSEPSVRELYVHWALMAAPFVPFIVLFCHTIETCDEAHLGDLAAVVEMLEMLPPDVPVLYQKQLRLFRIMYDVASKCVAAKSCDAAEVPSDTPFHMFFSEAGVKPPFEVNTQAGMQLGNAEATRTGAGTAMEGMQWGTELGTWFEQNHQIFTMLENS